MAMIKRPFLFPIPQDPRGWLSIALAIFLHVIFLAFLWFGVHGQNDAPKIIVAEMWNEQAHELAPAKNLELVTTRSLKAPQDVPAVSTVDVAGDQDKPKIEHPKVEMSKEVASRIDSPTTAVGGGADVKLQTSQSNTVWIGHVIETIMSNITYKVSSYDREANSRVEFSVKLLPDGMIEELSMTKSSGNAELDDAVRHAIEKSQPYPTDSSGSVPASFDGAILPVEIDRLQRQRELSEDD